MSTESVRQKRSEEKVRLYLDEKRGKKYHEKYHGTIRGLHNHPVFVPWVELFRKSWCDKMAH